jgi:hypothetical protein
MSDTGQAKRKQATSDLSSKALLDFVLTELNIGLQFAELARDSYRRNFDSDGNRQKAAAIHALQNAQKFLPQVDPTETQRAMIEQRVAELEIAMSRLPTRPYRAGSLASPDASREPT